MQERQPKPWFPARDVSATQSAEDSGPPRKLRSDPKMTENPQQTQPAAQPAAQQTQQAAQPVTVADLKIDALEKAIAELRSTAAQKDAIVDELIKTNKQLFAALQQKQETKTEPPAAEPAQQTAPPANEEPGMEEFMYALTKRKIQKLKNNDGM